VTLLKFTVFWDVTPYGLDEVCRRFVVRCRVRQRGIIWTRCLIFMATAVRTSDFINVYLYLLLLLLLLLTLQRFVCFDLCTSSHQAVLSLTRYVQCYTFNVFKSFGTSTLHLFFGRPLDLIPMGYYSIIFSIVFVVFILLTCPTMLSSELLCT
jgi:hypothetical protein